MSEHADASTYPLRIEGDLSDPPGRWLWLVKWLLTIPHWIVLFFLWIAFFFVSVIAFFDRMAPAPRNDLTVTSIVSP